MTRSGYLHQKRDHFLGILFIVIAVRMFTLKAQDKKVALETFYYTTTTYTPSILHLTPIRCNSLVISTLFSVRCYQCYLHTTYTIYMLPHGTSTGGERHSIGEQESLLLRQISLRPSGVQSTAYDKTNCGTAGCDV